jgi:signal peptidase II
MRGGYSPRVKLRKPILKVTLVLAIVAMCVGCDQATKQIARTRLAGRGVVALVDGIVVLGYVENEGAFLSLGWRLPPPARRLILTVMPLAVLAALAAYVLARRRFDTLTLVGAACIAGGGVGNLLDRLANGGRVSDFAMVGVGVLRSGVFNLADLSILAGCLLLLVASWRQPAKR